VNSLGVGVPKTMVTSGGILKNALTWRCTRSETSGETVVALVLVCATDKVHKSSHRTANRFKGKLRKPPFGGNNGKGNYLMGRAVGAVWGCQEKADHHRGTEAQRRLLVRKLRCGLFSGSERIYDLWVFSGVSVPLW
jgi:hypothetical protein